MLSSAYIFARSTPPHIIITTTLVCLGSCIYMYLCVFCSLLPCHALASNLKEMREQSFNINKYDFHVVYYDTSSLNIARSFETGCKGSGGLYLLLPSMMITPVAWCSLHFKTILWHGKAFKLITNQNLFTYSYFRRNLPFNIKYYSWILI